MRSGVVSIVGRPNVGKSTLLNTLLERKLAITSDKAETTRNTILGVYNDDDVQIVFVDTPGIHKPLNRLGTVLNQTAFHAIQDVDVVLFLVDAKTGIGKGDLFILNRLKEANAKVILVLNKIDGMKKDDIFLAIQKASQAYDFAEVVPISALKEKNIKELIKTITPYLSNEGKLYEDDTITNISTKFYVAEIVREKILQKTEKEVPHTVTCYVELLEEEDDLVSIQVCIVVERDNLKKIIIGKRGSMLKQIGSEARKDLEEYFSKKVYLQTYVKTIDNWRDKEKYLIDLGFENHSDF
ncbi:gTPase Era [Bacillus sp. CAG:988]|nr:gTPase Era [Bacillus sp. CAG:988]